MRYSPYFPLVHVDLEAIRHNYRLLQSKVPALERERPARLPVCPDRHGDRVFFWPELMPVLKADAYGHGHIPVADALYQEGARVFASGSVHEAELLRQGLLNGQTALKTGEPPVIICLLGLVRREDVDICADSGLVPTLYSFEQLDMLEGARRPLAVAVKCDTGMSRLGFAEEELGRLRERLLRMEHVVPVLALSHLHSADMEAGCRTALAQAAVFARMLSLLRETWPNLGASLANSAGTLLGRELTERTGGQISRPGLAVYGLNPFSGTSLAPLGQDLRPAMSVSAPVLCVRTLERGKSYGYGQDFTAEKDMPMGVVGAGYAECYARNLSRRGVMCIDGKRVRVIGRVSMQMTGVDLSPLATALDRKKAPLTELPRPKTAWILGGPFSEGVSAEELAGIWGTIPYEALCLLGRNTRLYSKPGLPVRP